MWHSRKQNYYDEGHTVYLSHFQDETSTFLTVHRGVYVILPLKRSLSSPLAYVFLSAKKAGKIMNTVRPFLAPSTRFGTRLRASSNARESLWVSWTNFSFWYVFTLCDMSRNTRRLQRCHFEHCPSSFRISMYIVIAGPIVLRTASGYGTNSHFVLFFLFPTVLPFFRLWIYFLNYCLFVYWL